MDESNGIGTFERPLHVTGAPLRLACGLTASNPKCAATQTVHLVEVFIPTPTGVAGDLGLVVVHFRYLRGVRTLLWLLVVAVTIRRNTRPNQ